MNMKKVYAIENHPNDSRATIDPNGIVQTLSSRMGTGWNNTPFVLITSMKADTQNGNHTKQLLSESLVEVAETEVKASFVLNSSGDGVAAPLDASYYKGQGTRQGIEREFVMIESYCCGNGQLDQTRIQDKVGCLDCMHDQKMVLIKGYYTKQRHDEFIDGKVASSLKSRDYNEYTDVVQEEHNRKYVLRRLTPVECARLQGFPDSFVLPLADVHLYKQFGNSVTVPVIETIAKEIRKVLEGQCDTQGIKANGVNSTLL